MVEIGGAVASRQGLNIPGEADGAAGGARGGPRACCATGEKIGVDIVALSFVRRAEDIECVREHTRLPLIAKIEKPQAVERAEEIVRAADCVMVARGDLGIELPIEEVPIVQKQVHRAGRRARPARRSPRRRCSTRWSRSSRPTRAEVADVANAILDGTDAVMLSQESAVGQYPVERGGDDGRRSPSGPSRSRPTREWNERACGATAATPPTRSPTPPARAARELGLAALVVPDAVGPLGAADLRAPARRCRSTRSRRAARPCAAAG